MTEQATNDPFSVTVETLEPLRVEEAVQFVESAGLPYYVTTTDVLWVQAWQQVAKLELDEAAVVRRHQTMPREAGSLDWVSVHLAELTRVYRGHWIAVLDNRVVADARDLSALLASVRAQGIREPFITHLPERQPPRYTAYVAD